MLQAANVRGFHPEIPRFGMSRVASKLRAKMLEHAELILRIALLAGAFVGYALSVAR